VLQQAIHPLALVLQTALYVNLKPNANTCVLVLILGCFMLVCLDIDNVLTSWLLKIVESVQRCHIAFWGVWNAGDGWCSFQMDPPPAEGKGMGMLPCFVKLIN